MVPAGGPTTITLTGACQSLRGAPCTGVTHSIPITFVVTGIEDFSLQAALQTVTVSRAGAPAATTVSAWLVDGFIDVAVVTATGLPPGVSAVFSATGSNVIVLGGPGSPSSGLTDISGADPATSRIRTTAVDLVVTP